MEQLEYLEQLFETYVPSTAEEAEVVAYIRRKLSETNEGRGASDEEHAAS
jgi:uncharacterized coiled-coil DUF342 family protein